MDRKTNEKLTSKEGLFDLYKEATGDFRARELDGSRWV